MAARLTLAVPISIPSVAFIDNVTFLSDDPDLTHPQIPGNPVGEAQIQVEARLVGNLPVPFVTVLRIINTFAEGVRAKPTPTSAVDVVEKFSTTTGTGIATAYDTVKAAYRSGGRAALISQLQTLRLLPAGGVALLAVDAEGNYLDASGDIIPGMRERRPLPGF